MKYLKLYEALKHDNEVNEYLNDILLDIEDIDGVYLSCGVTNDDMCFPYLLFTIYPFANNRFVLTKEICEIIERCEKYINSMGLKVIIRVNGDDLTMRLPGIKSASELYRYVGKSVDYIQMKIDMEMSF